MRLVVTRPEPDATALKAQLVAQGHEVLVEPLMELSFDDADPIEVVGAQALIATSRNAVRALARSLALDDARDLPLFAVGPGTAATARSLGLVNVIAGRGTVADLIPALVDCLEVNAGPVVYLAGEVVTGDLPGELRRLGFHVLEPVVYAMNDVKSFSSGFVARVRAGAVGGVVLLSPRTARIWVKLLRSHEIADWARRMHHFCLSAAVARQLAPLGDVPVAIAREPNLQQVLALTAADGPQFN